ncbi:MAG TPA: winged helix-turn-helix domain-containing protein, partial [Myxococcota bacterium]|nr:winged helix-turn-helix domain-containing protein [Myxococcota bacterium]
MSTNRAEGPAFLRFVPPIMESLRELGGAGSVEEVWRRVIERLALSDDELAETTASGQLRVRNQFHWARFYLK